MKLYIKTIILFITEHPQDSTKLILPSNSYAICKSYKGLIIYPNVDYGPCDGNLLIKYRGDTVLNNGFQVLS